MKHIAIIFFALIIIIAVEGRATADECDDNGKLQGTYLQKCKARLNSHCKHEHGTSKTRCIERAIKTALDSQERLRAREAERAKIDGEWGTCRSDAYASACSELTQFRNNTCQTAHNQPDFGIGKIDKMADMWIERYQAYEKMRPTMDTFQSKYGKCSKAPSGYRPHCQFFEHERNLCIKAGENFRSNWTAYVGDFERKTVSAMQAEIDRLRKAKKAPSGKGNFVVSQAVQTIAAIKRVSAAAAWLGSKKGQLDRIAVAVKEKSDAYGAAMEKLISKVKCPVKKKGSGSFYKILLKHYEASKDPSSTMVESVKRFQATGKKRRTREAHTRTTHEDQPASLCVEQRREEQTNCRIFQVTFRRSKIDGSSWGSWGFYSTGGGDLMSCKNLH